MWLCCLQHWPRLAFKASICQCGPKGFLSQAQQQAQHDSSSAEQAAAQMSSLIPEYRSTLARMKKQVDALHAKLEGAYQERDALQQQVCSRCTMGHVLHCTCARTAMVNTLELRSSLRIY